MPRQSVPSSCLTVNEHLRLHRAEVQPLVCPFPPALCSVLEVTAMAGDVNLFLSQDEETQQKVAEIDVCCAHCMNWFPGLMGKHRLWWLKKAAGDVESPKRLFSSCLPTVIICS